MDKDVTTNWYCMAGCGAVLTSETVREHKCAAIEKVEKKHFPKPPHPLELVQKLQADCKTEGPNYYPVRPELIEALIKSIQHYVPPEDTRNAEERNEEIDRLASEFADKQFSQWESTLAYFSFRFGYNAAMEKMRR